MVTTISDRLPARAGGAKPATGESKSLAQEVIAAGIDDLAKYRIMALVYESPNLCGDADCFAAYLGFHSSELAALELDELVACGLLSTEERRGDSRPCYRLAGHDVAVNLLIRLYGRSWSPAEQHEALQVLARRSLRRASARSLVRNDASAGRKAALRCRAAEG